MPVLEAEAGRSCRLAKIGRCRFSERPCLKNKRGKENENILILMSDPYSPMWTSIHKYALMQTHNMHVYVQIDRHTHAGCLKLKR